LSEDEKDALRAERGGSHWRFKLDHKRIEWTGGDAEAFQHHVCLIGCGHAWRRESAVTAAITEGVGGWKPLDF